MFNRVMNDVVREAPEREAEHDLAVRFAREPLPGPPREWPDYCRQVTPCPGGVGVPRDHGME